MSTEGTKRTATEAAKDARVRRRLTAVIALFLWLLFCAFTYVWCQVQVVQLGYKLSQVHQVHTRLLNDNKTLHLELARLRAPERVERVALQQLGLKQPRKDQIVVLP